MRPARRGPKADAGCCKTGTDPGDHEKVQTGEREATLARTACLLAEDAAVLVVSRGGVGCLSRRSADEGEPYRCKRDRPPGPYKMLCRLHFKPPHCCVVAEVVYTRADAALTAST